MTATAALALALAAAQEAAPYAPHLEPASDEARQAIARFQIPEDFAVSLFAAEPRLAHPVCFWIDAGGRDVYVAETFRHHAGVTDIRDHMDWLDDDLQSRTVEERVSMYARHLGERFDEYAREHERVRLIRDRDGDGEADLDQVFADGFRGHADGIGAGLLARGGDVYYACIPSLWLLRDEDGDGRADLRRALSTGWGVRVALLGHDLHGLALGPDGRLYFSCGDRGFSVETERGRIEHPHTGAVLRCNLDGSGLEVFATGLRNPQELAFDDGGELFSGDNNSDGGDRARLVHVVEGGDSGWRQAYQWITTPNLRGPWNDEKLWHPRHPGQAAYIVPPIENLGDGPSGLAFHPGTALSGRYAGRFFLCDFRGDASISGIHAFALEPAGASFALGAHEWFLKGALVTDCDFGPDGALWFSDWTQGWNKTGKGRLYRADLRLPAGAERRAETAELLRAGMRGRPIEDLARLFAHPDRRVRLEAQIELAARGAGGENALLAVARRGASAIERLHGVWGLRQCASSPTLDPRPALIEKLADESEPVRAQAARALGDLRCAGAAALLERMLAGEGPSARLQAAIALGKIGARTSVERLFALLRETGEADPVLRHGAIFGLAGCASPERLVAAKDDPSVPARLGAVVALRRLGHVGLAAFAGDPAELVAAEAARAIYDGEVSAALPALAARAGRGDLAGTPQVRRVLAACLRLGGEDRARAVSRLALRADLDEKLRSEALSHLVRWTDPPRRDPVTGEWRPLERSEEERVEAARYLPAIARELAAVGVLDGPAPVAEGWLALAGALDLEAEVGRIEALALDAERAAAVRAAALRALKEIAPPALVATLERALFDREALVRAAALDALQAASPEQALPVIEQALRAGSVEELRVAFAALGRLGTAEADGRIAGELARLEAGLVPAEAALELVLAAERRAEHGLREALDARAARRKDEPALGRYVDGLYGGDAERGRKIFREKAELACLRCHRIEDGEGGEVGPDLRGVGPRQSRLQLLESIALPSRRIAEGWRATQFLLADERLVEGRILDEDAERVRIAKSDGTVEEIPLEDVAERRAGLSAMPDGHAEHLSREEMRDLIEYLSRIPAKEGP